MAKQEFRAAQRSKPIGDAGIEACRKIAADKQCGKVNEVAVDSYSASAVIMIYDKVGPEVQSKMQAMPVARLVDIAFKIINTRA